MVYGSGAACAAQAPKFGPKRIVPFLRPDVSGAKRRKEPSRCRTIRTPGNQPLQAMSKARLCQKETASGTGESPSRSTPARPPFGPDGLHLLFSVDHQEEYSRKRPALQRNTMPCGSRYGDSKGHDRRSCSKQYRPLQCCTSSPARAPAGKRRFPYGRQYTVRFPKEIYEDDEKR